MRYVANTHVHGDHISGNPRLGAIATIIAHRNTRVQMATQGPNCEDTPEPSIALPVIALSDHIFMDIDDEAIEIRHVSRAHSDTGVVAFFRTSKVVHLGDLYFSNMFPFIGVGGSVDGLILALKRLLKDMPADTNIIPGHGAASNPNELRECVSMLKSTRNIVRQGIASKTSLDTLKREKVFSQFARRAEGGYVDADQFLTQMYRVMYLTRHRAA